MPEPASAAIPSQLQLDHLPELRDLLERAPGVLWVTSPQQAFELSLGGPEFTTSFVDYKGAEGRWIREASITRVRNGIVVNYNEPYMRRRDPDAMVIGDEKPTDKPRYKDRFGVGFDPLRKETMDWLAGQQLAVMAFTAGQEGMGTGGIAVVPKNAAFFAFALALLQGMIPPDELPEGFKPGCVIYVAPPFRHTHFGGRQVVVHCRQEAVHEIFAYNLYPGPSAKKGVYGVLIDLGEAEGWITAHCSAVRVVTPYDNEIVFMHEGASGGGKSEMLEYPHRLSDGRIHLGKNTVTGETRYIEIPRGCRLEPAIDDMALCHKSLQDDDGKLGVIDAENAWFVRVNHLREYGTDMDMEKLTAKPPEPILFLNIDAAPDSRAMIWEHIEDSPGKPCPNPRVILPRRIIPNIVNTPLKVDVRSFGVRTPPCTREKPTYGIIGLVHVLPPALAWLWRLVAPRGHANPSIITAEGLASEGVGSYWPFATGRRIDQANLLLEQFRRGKRMRYVLIPNQYIGAWEVGFMPNWLAREYLARRGMAKFKPEHIGEARCPLLGYAVHTMQIEGRAVARWFMEVNTQPEVGEEGYDAGAKLLTTFFHQELNRYLVEDLDPEGRQIIEACLQGADVKKYETFMPMYG